MKRNKRTLLSALFLPLAAGWYTAEGQTLQQCQQWTENNYPLIAQYDLVEKTKEYDINAAANGWIPKIVLSAQATYQSDVVNFPEEFNNMMNMAGIHFEGMRKDQYRVALDIEQPLWDGGTSMAAKAVAKAEAGVKTKSIEAQLYALRERINGLFFGILLLDEQLKLNNELQGILADNVRKAEALVKEGVATNGDVLAIKVEQLKAAQDRTAVEATRRAYVSVLETFTAHSIDSLVMPDDFTNGTQSNYRPEMELFELRLDALNAQRKMVNNSVIPRFSLFAQGFYGSPGLNMFEDMLHPHFSLNGIMGVRMQWNIGGLFTRSNSMKQIETAGRQVMIDRDMFLFNNNMKQAEQAENIEAKRQIVQQDDEIIKLRSEVRLACEAKVENGIADANDLLREIANENMAKISAATHKVDLLKLLYDLKITEGEAF